MFTDLKIKKSWAAAVSLLLIISIFIGGIGNSGLSGDDIDGEDEQIILVKAGGEEERTLLDEMDLNVIDTYNDFALVEAGESTMKSLKSHGLRVNSLPSRTELSVKGHTFDVDQGRPELDTALTMENYESGTEGTYIIHMLGPVNPGWRESLEEKGADIINYVPNYAYEVRMTPEIAEDIEDLFFVDWVGIYQPEYKIQPSLSEIDEDKLAVNVEFIQNPDPRTIDTIRSKFAVNKSLNDGNRGYLTVDVTSEGEIEELALMNDVYFISRYVEPELHSEVDSQMIGGGAWFMDDEHDDPTRPYRKHGDFGAYINQIGYTGKNVTIAVADTGIGNGTAGDAGHPDLTGRVIGGHGFEDLEDDHWVDGHGHGTHVSGSIAGDTYGGTGEEGEYPGFGPYMMAQGLA
ncbi:MAG: S8 family serine peptidase, partial [Candidatus Thermoplasmatota archaeon]